MTAACTAISRKRNNGPSAKAVIKDLGYDFDRGRQDKTHHPFMTRFSSGDVRITTRIDESDLSGGLFSTIHEAGHALYEQGIDTCLRWHAPGRRHFGRGA